MDLWGKLKTKALTAKLDTSKNKTSTNKKDTAKKPKKSDKRVPDNEPKKLTYISPAYKLVIDSVMKEQKMLEQELTNIRLGTLRQRPVVRRRRVKRENKENVVNTDKTNLPDSTAAKSNNDIKTGQLNRFKPLIGLKEQVRNNSNAKITVDDTNTNGNVNILSLIVEEHNMNTTGERRESEPLKSSQGMFVQRDDETGPSSKSKERKHSSTLSSEQNNSHVQQWIESLPESLEPVSVTDAKESPESDAVFLEEKNESKDLNETLQGTELKAVGSKSGAENRSPSKKSLSRGGESRRSTGSIGHMSKGGAVNTTTNRARRVSEGSNISMPHSTSDNRRRGSFAAIEEVAAAQSQHGSVKSDRRSAASKSEKDTKAVSLTSSQRGSAKSDQRGGAEKSEKVAKATEKTVPQKDLITNPELFNADGTYRTKLTMPSADKRWEQAKNARYIRSNDAVVVERERELEVVEIFAAKGKSKK